jgi:predicted amidophosphoribosyltransferase
MRGWFGELWGLVLPVSCAGCGAGRELLCADCAAGLYGRGAGRVRPRPEPVGLPVVHAAAPYRDGVREVLLAHKERGALGLAKPLGAALAGAVQAGLPEEEEGYGDGYGDGGGDGIRGVTVPAAGEVGLVPMPSSGRAVRARGHDATLRIARVAAGVLRGAGLPARVLAVLGQRRTPADQAGLDARERLVNMGDALEVVRGGTGPLTEVGRIVLVDDLMTTGASLAEAARAVRVATDAPARSGTPSGDLATRGEKAGPITLCAAVIASSPDSFEINRN